MPYKAKKPCAHQGCRELTASRYCEAHTKQEAKRYNQYERNPESNKRYGRIWKQIRAAFLSANPLCAMCYREGRLIPATVAHHKIKVTDGGLHAWENLTALCELHHSRLHAEQGDYF